MTPFPYPAPVHCWVVKAIMHIQLTDYVELLKLFYNVCPLCACIGYLENLNNFICLELIPNFLMLFGYSLWSVGFNCSWDMNFSTKKNELGWCFRYGIKENCSHHELTGAVVSTRISSYPSCKRTILILAEIVLFFFLGHQWPSLFLKWEEISFCYLSFKWINWPFVFYLLSSPFIYLFFFWNVWAESEIGITGFCIVLRFSMVGMGRFLLTLIKKNKE